MRLRFTIPPLDTLTPSEGRMFRSWLRGLEALARKAVLIEAAAIAKTLSKIPIPYRATHKPKPKPQEQKPKQPAWMTQRKRHPRMRLWPKFKAAARIRALGRPVLVRDIWAERRRKVLIARLAQARTRRKPKHIRLADRLDALERVIDAPTRAAKRLAKKLILVPALAATIALALQPEPRAVDEKLANDISFASAAVAYPDSS